MREETNARPSGGGHQETPTISMMTYIPPRRFTCSGVMHLGDITDSAPIFYPIHLASYAYATVMGVLLVRAKAMVRWPLPVRQVSK
jgi:hypothetical protein